MTRKVSDTASQARRAATAPSRPRPSAIRRASGRVRSSLEDAMPQPRRSPEALPSSAHPVLSWVLVTDENGRTRPEARWEA